MANAEHQIRLGCLVGNKEVLKNDRDTSEGAKAAKRGTI